MARRWRMEAVQQRTSLEVQKSHKKGPIIHFFVIWGTINVISLIIIRYLGDDRCYQPHYLHHYSQWLSCLVGKVWGWIRCNGIGLGLTSKVSPTKHQDNDNLIHDNDGDHCNRGNHVYNIESKKSYIVKCWL